MKKANNQLKMLANLARQRMLNKNYGEKEMKSVFESSASSYFIKNAKALRKFNSITKFEVLSEREDEKLIKKIYSLLEEDDLVFNMLSRLVDKDVYKSLNDIEKQQYMLTLSDKYNKIKEAYYKTHTA